MVQSNNNLQNSQRQQNLQQQYKQNIVQFNSTTNNKLQTIKSTDKHVAINAETLEKQKKNKKSTNKKTSIANTPATGVPTRSKKAIKQNFNKKGKLAPAPEKIDTNEATNDNKPTAAVDDSKRRRSSAAMWNLKEKAAMPYGNFDAKTNNQTAIDDDEENLLQLGFMNPNMQQNRPVQQMPQNWQPSSQNGTPLQQNGFMNINHTTQMMNPGMPNMMPMGMHNGSMMMPQGHPYPPPMNPLQHQGHLGLPNIHSMQLPNPNMMPKQNNYHPMNTLGNPNYHTNNMIVNNHMMIREQHSPVIPSLPLNTRVTPTSYSDNYMTGNPVMAMDKRKQAQSTGQLSSEGSVKQERYAGTSFGVSAPMLKSFPKPSF